MSGRSSIMALVLNDMSYVEILRGIEVSVYGVQGSRISRNFVCLFGKVPVE